MLRPLRFLWKQFNGPQVSALFTPVFRWLQGQFNDNIDYLNKFDLTSSTEEHLTLVGACMGIIRPLVVIPSGKFFLFTRDPEHDSDHGLSDLNNLSVGGLFSSLEEDLRSKSTVLCPATYYKRILESYRDNDDAKNSLAFVLDTVISIWQEMHPTSDPTLSGIGLHWYTETDVAFGVTRTYGDIEVLMGERRNWGDDDTSVIWQGVLQGVFRELFAPEIVIDFNFTA